MAKKKVTEIVEQILLPFLEEEGYELYDTEFVKEGSDWFLRAFIERAPEDGKREYVSTEDCEKVSRFLSEKLDESDPIERNYYLEVSSPGMDRVLSRPEHYERYVGEAVDVRLYRGVDGKKELSGIMDAWDGETMKLTCEDGKEYELKMTEIARTRLAVIL